MVPGEHDAVADAAHDGLGVLAGMNELAGARRVAVGAQDQPQHDEQRGKGQARGQRQTNIAQRDDPENGERVDQRGEEEDVPEIVWRDERIIVPAAVPAIMKKSRWNLRHHSDFKRTRRKESAAGKSRSTSVRYQAAVKPKNTYRLVVPAKRQPPPRSVLPCRNRCRSRLRCISGGT